jgi:glycosyltransferase involved in cell wall biosynthesis
MQKVLLYFPLELKGNENSGIAKKCLGIVDAFKQQYQTDVFTDAYGKIHFNGRLIKDYNSSGLKSRLYNYNDIVFGQFNKIGKELRENKYDVLYFRFHYFLSWGMIIFFKKIKTHNPSAKIFLELPTYPFKSEKGKSIAERFRYSLNRFLIPYLKRYVDNIVTFAQLPSIWGIPAITISNGYYDPVLQQIIQKTTNQLAMVPDNEFHMAMVARFTTGHAPDIVIKSLKAYYDTKPEKNVFVHMIGYDGALGLCKTLTKEYALEDKVIYYGECKTDKIVNILSRVHVCIGTLGMSRKNITIDSSLKSREYAFMGMPMILRTTDLDMLPSLFFVKYFPEPESLLNIQEIMDFYEDLKKTYPNYKEEIQQFAKHNLTWVKKMQPVFDKIENCQIEN